MNCPSGADGSTTTQLKPDTENFRVRLCSSSVHVPPLLCLLMSGFLPLNNLTPMDPPPPAELKMSRAKTADRYQHNVRT